jgi:hypothetical protein
MRLTPGKKKNEEQVTALANVLPKWNPLGAAAQELSNLDSYRVETADILFGLKIRGRSARAEQFSLRTFSTRRLICALTRKAVPRMRRKSWRFFNRELPDHRAVNDLMCR